MLEATPTGYRCHVINAMGGCEFLTGQAGIYAEGSTWMRRMERIDSIAYWISKARHKGHSFVVVARGGLLRVRRNPFHPPQPVEPSA